MLDVIKLIDTTNFHIVAGPGLCSTRFVNLLKINILKCMESSRFRRLLSSRFTNLVMYKPGPATIWNIQNTCCFGFARPSLGGQELSSTVFATGRRSYTDDAQQAPTSVPRFLQLFQWCCLELECTRASLQGSHWYIYIYIYIFTYIYICEYKWIDK